MTLGRYLIMMVAGTFLGWAAFVIVLVSVDPGSASWIGFGLFYASLAAALVGTFATFGLLFRVFVLRRQVVLRQVLVSFRQGVSFAALIAGLLILQGRGYLTWWSMLLFVLSLTALEFLIISLSRPPRQAA